MTFTGERMAELKYVGLDDINIDAFERSKVEDLARKHMEKLGRAVHNEFEAVLQFKGYHKEGERTKYSIHLRVAWPGGTITASKDDWFLANAVKATFEAAEAQLAHRFKD